MNPYESRKLLAEYLLFHYGSPSDVLGDYPGPADAVHFAQRLVKQLLDPDRIPAGTGRALDLGCAVGGSSFELARYFPEVAGIDFSSSFIFAAKHLAAHGCMETEVAVEGTRTRQFTARLAPEIDRSRVAFSVGDAMSLPANMGSFDVVVAANLLCRLPDPGQFLKSLPALLAPGGQLLLTTPFSWLEEYTPEENWLGGKPGAPASFEVLSSILASSFALDHVVEIPFLIREHARKFQYTIACGSRWIRK